MSSPPPDFGARDFAKRNRGFSWMGLVVGAALLVGGVALGVKAGGDLLQMPSGPLRCAAAECPSGTWVLVTDAAWDCEGAHYVRGPYAYVPIGVPGLLATVDKDDRTCREQAAYPAEGVIEPLSARSPLAETMELSSTRILWVGHGPSNSRGLVVVGAAFAMVGVLCLWFYGRALRRRGSRDPT